MFGRSLLVMTRLLQLCDIHPFPIEPTHAPLLFFVCAMQGVVCGQWVSLVCGSSEGGAALPGTAPH
jgi:hypothetical protein